MQQCVNCVQTRGGAAVAGANVMVKTYPGGTTATIYSDDGVTEQTNPITTDANGQFAFYAADGRYTLVISKTGYITQQTLTDSVLLLDPDDGEPSISSADVSHKASGTGALNTDLQTRGQKFVLTSDYSSVTNFNTAKALLVERMGVGGIDVTRTGGTVATGSVYLNDVQVTFTGDSGGATDVSAVRVLHTSNGANAVSQSIAGRFQNQQTGAGTITTMRGILAENRMDGAGNVDSALGISTQFILTSTGSINTNVQNIRIAAPTITGAGTIPVIDGVRVSNQGHAKVTDVFCFRAEDQSSATGSMYGFRGELTAGTGKWNVYSSGNALNHFNGAVLVGSTTDDTVNKLQVTGIAISFSDTLISAEGGSFKAANNTTKGKYVQVGYDGTLDVGYIKALHAATANKNLAFGQGAALSTSSVGGHIMIPACSGTPSGAPVGAGAGLIPMIFDTSGVKIWFYTGSAWKGVVVA